MPLIHASPVPDDKWTYLALGLLGGGVLAGVLLWLSRQAGVTTFEVIRDEQGNIISVQKRTGLLARMGGGGGGEPLGDFLTT